MESIFQFSNPSLLKLDFRINDDFDSDTGKKVKLNLRVETRVNRKENSEEAFVVLCLTVGGKTDELPFYIYAEEAAKFRWSKGGYDEEAIKRLLEQNAPALLLSYLRPIVASVTRFSPYNAYDIPFINFKAEK